MKSWSGLLHPSYHCLDAGRRWIWVSGIKKNRWGGIQRICRGALPKMEQGQNSRPGVAKWATGWSERKSVVHGEQTKKASQRPGLDTPTSGYFGEGMVHQAQNQTRPESGIRSSQLSYQVVGQRIQKSTRELNGGYQAKTRQRLEFRTRNGRWWVAQVPEVRKGFWVIVGAHQAKMRQGSECRIRSSQISYQVVGKGFRCPCGASKTGTRCLWWLIEPKMGQENVCRTKGVVQGQDNEYIYIVLDISDSGGALDMSYTMLEGVCWNLRIVVSIVTHGKIGVWV